MNKSARCAPRLNAREAAENAEMLLIAAEQCAEILADLPKTKANESATGGGKVGNCPGGGVQGARYRGDHARDPKAAGIGAQTQPNRMPIA